MSPAQAGSRPSAGDGVVLRDVAVHRHPRALARPATSGAMPPAGLARDRDERAAASGPAELPRASALPSEEATPPPPSPYQQGYEAGLAEAEAAHKAVIDGALEHARRGGFEQGLREGREQGLGEGRASGQEAAAREARAAREELADRLERLDGLLSALPAELSRRLASAEDDMVALCHAAICRILGEELVTREGVARSVREAVREACSGSTPYASDRALLAIHVHPRDLDALQGDETLAAWLRHSHLCASRTVRWVADERVALGGCIVASGEGSLDARLETQLAALRQVLLQERPQEPGE